MNVIIVGSGLLGVSTAYHLHRQGHNVTVIDRRESAGLETSFANGGLLTPSLSDPWNAPGVFFNMLKMIGKEDSPLLLRPKALPSLAFWGLSFLKNSSRKTYEQSIFRNTRMAKYTLDVLDSMTTEMGLSDLGGGNGTLKVCRHNEELDEVLAMAEFLKPEAVKFSMLTREETFELEPSLAPLNDKLAGSIYFPEDRFGDAHQYCVEVSKYLENAGVRFLYSTTVNDIHKQNGKITHLDTSQGQLDADAFVLAAGSYSPLLASKVGINLPVKPCKGYSLTLELDGWQGGPKVPVIDHSLHAAVVPIGNRIRVAGTAEFNGYDKDLNAGRLQNLYDLLHAIYPESTPFVSPETTKHWTGLRPVSASGVPLIGRSKIGNLYINTGHGHLGWTMSAGSGKALADLMSGITPEITLDDYAVN
ncbi:D-amino acid dehydrogenase [Shewanella aestuarii]|uniref:D-amino acid dehydrogenase n=1 Tax=Shewanella aestuarii TaxID=1028752 RepID=A0A6G9QP34_9GAMM|nr:D-amino acid dehydrogenase [Shewanella aestuarii]QIR15817.1 D-amino acid dehydrogenase [Shewanella aestuarii]